MKVLVIGGTLFIGRLLVEELVKEGHEVAILHRKSKHDFGRRVENIMADRNDEDSLREALYGRRFEVVYDNAYDWENGTTVTQVEFVEKLAKVANVEPTLVRVPRDAIMAAGGNAMSEPYYFGEYLDVTPITEYMGKAPRVLKVKMTPFDVGMKETYRSYVRSHKSRGNGFEFDNRLMSLSRAGSPASV